MRQFSYLSRLKTREDGSSRVATTSWPECMTGIWIIATPLNGNITEIATPAIIRWLKKNFPWLLALVLGLSLSSNQSLIIRQIRQLYIHWWKWRVPRPCVPRPPVGTPKFSWIWWRRAAFMFCLHCLRFGNNSCPFSPTVQSIHI